MDVLEGFKTKFSIIEQFLIEIVVTVQNQSGYICLLAGSVAKW